MTEGSRQGVGGEGGQGTGEHDLNDEWLMTEERRGRLEDWKPGAGREGGQAKPGGGGLGIADFEI